MTNINELRDRAATFGSDYLTDEEWVEVIDRLEAAEKERDGLRHCFNEWIDKTEGVQRGINEGTISPKYLGLHRADVIASLLGAAEKERDALRAELNEIRYGVAVAHDTIKALHADKATLQQMTYSLKDRLEAAEKERVLDEQRIADLMADLNRVGHENDNLRTKVEQMEQQEPVWFIDERGEPKRYHKSKADYCKYGGLDLLYALPGAKGVPKC